MFYLIETLEQLKQFEQEEHFDDCYIEFIQGISGGEEKWKAGWRPKKLQEKN